MVESDEEVTQGDFQFFSQIHRILGGRAVVNPPLVHQTRESSVTYTKIPLEIGIIPPWHNVLIERCIRRLCTESSF